MAQLPNADDAILDIRKLEQYCLDESHPRGQHKARVFKSVLGLTATDSAWLRLTILQSVPRMSATALASDEFGARYRVDVPVERQGARGVIRTIWIIPGVGDVPRFVTCWVL